MASDVARNLAYVKHIILVLSGKGGVGKSTVSTELALSLHSIGKRVGVLDIDLTGPSIPRMFGVQGRQVLQASTGWVPVFADNEQRLGIISLGFLLKNQEDAVIWRGPKKNAMIKQFLTDVTWGQLDYLIIDTPPGTSDEHISIAEYLKELSPDGAVVVTTPQGVSLSDVRKELDFCKKVNMTILGIVENMSGYICPHCSEHHDIFSSGGGESLATEFKVPFLGKIPLDSNLVSLIEQDAGSFINRFKESNLAPVFMEIVQKLIAIVELTDIQR